MKWRRAFRFLSLLVHEFQNKLEITRARHLCFQKNGCSIVPPCGKTETKTIAVKLSAFNDCIQCANGHSRIKHSIVFYTQAEQKWWTEKKKISNKSSTWIEVWESSTGRSKFALFFPFHNFLYKQNSEWGKRTSENLQPVQKQQTIQGRISQKSEISHNSSQSHIFCI